MADVWAAQAAPREDISFNADRHLTPAASLKLRTPPTNGPGCITITDGKHDAVIVVDAQDYPVVHIAANLFADDVRRVSGRRSVVTHAPSGSAPLVIAGTLGHSALIEQLIAGGKLQSLDHIKGQWEATVWQVVEQPFPGVERALVIVGSDRRGTAYGLMELSKCIGVSPWYWWADVPVQRRAALGIEVGAPQADAPAVKYRGIFINDEDWGLFPWAAKTFDPEFGNIGPKTYERVFELMLRLRLNYFWPAMHECSRAFDSVPENAELAGRYGLVAGTSHCEPMLFNNAKWNEAERGKWDYSLNRGTIHSIWENSARTRAREEAVWTLGIRGIHDRGMQGPKDRAARMNILSGVIEDQRALLREQVTTEWGPVAQCFVPYKEVLPLYDAGLKVPDDVTLVWVDDNFGYIRRLGAPAERARTGGAGVYWHLSYYGGPHSYTWISTTAPALMWEELHKAWENDARKIWVINVGDIKPMEIGIDYFARLAWNPDGFPLGAQRQFLHDFAAENLGKNVARATADLLMDFYRLGTVRKPELMERRWALSLTPERAAQLERDYLDLLGREQALATEVSAAARDAYTEMVGFPARVLGNAGLIFMADRSIQMTNHVAANESKIAELRTDLEAQVENYNTKIADGKWRGMMPGLMTASDLTRWNSQVRWPWGEPTNHSPVIRPQISEGNWRTAASADRQPTQGPARWVAIPGLGASGQAMALKPAGLASAWSVGDPNAPALEYHFDTTGGAAKVLIDFLPTFRLCPGMKLRVAVGVDGKPPVLVEVPGSSGADDEQGKSRLNAVQDNYVRATVPLPGLSAGKHVLKIHAVDPGAVIDQVALP